MLGRLAHVQRRGRHRQLRVAQRHPDLVVAAFLEDPPLYMGEPAEHEDNGAVPLFGAILATVERWKARG